MSNKKRKEKAAYQAVYPSYLSWSRRVWVVQEGDLFLDEDTVYKVTQVIRSHIPGAKPRIVMQKLTPKPGTV
jgi:hypothetical protein